MLIACSLPLGVEASFSSPSSGMDGVIQTIQAALKAAESSDLDAFTSHLTPDFYMYDAGKRFDAASIIAQMKKLRESGTQYHWQVATPDVHIDGNSAWIAYVNDGTVTAPTGVTKRRWLESASLINTGGTWQIAFWHSTPVGAAP